MLNLEQKQKLKSERYRLLYLDEFPLEVNTVEELLTIWPELEDVTTEKNKEKSHFVLRDKEDCFKIYFYKSGYVKKVNDNNTQHLFLNNWYHNFDVDNIQEIKLYPYSLNLCVQHAHEFMISKKIYNNIEMYFDAKREKNQPKRQLDF